MEHYYKVSSLSKIAWKHFLESYYEIQLIVIHLLKLQWATLWLTFAFTWLCKHLYSFKGKVSLQSNSRRLGEKVVSYHTEWNFMWPLLLMPLLLTKWSWSNSVYIHECLRETPCLQTTHCGWRHNINILIIILSLFYQLGWSNFKVSPLRWNFSTRLIGVFKEFIYWNMS